MFNYEKLFKPYTKDGAALENSIKWLKKTSGADDSVVNLVVTDVMNQLANGKKFKLPCQCGCKLNNVHTPINHYMLSEALSIIKQTEKIKANIIQEHQKALVEKHLKILKGRNKEINKKYNGTFGNKIKKFFGLPYEKWRNE